MTKPKKDHPKRQHSRYVDPNETAFGKMASSADRHVCYEEAVQDVKQELLNIYNFYMDIRDAIHSPGKISVENDLFEHRIPLILREDFCGTAILCREWIKRNVMRSSIGIDLDPQIIQYAKNVTFEGSHPDNMTFLCENVTNVTPQAMGIQPADIIVALNYSIGYFHTFSDLTDYFCKVKQGLAVGGIFVCDMFSPAKPKKMSTCEYCFSRKCGDFTYYFEQSSLDLLTNLCHCHISFQFNDGSWLRRAFSYHFRIWAIAEVRDALKHSGFTKIETWFYQNESDEDTAISPGFRELFKMSPGAKQPVNQYNYYMIAA